MRYFKKEAIVLILILTFPIIYLLIRSTEQMFLIKRKIKEGYYNAVATKNTLGVEKASVLAARLANDKCEQLRGKRPFSAESYTAEFTNNIWHWGRNDPAGIRGFSAEVSFAPDGSHPKVEVYLNNDSLDIKLDKHADKLQ